MFLKKNSLIKELCQYAIEVERRLRKVNKNKDKDTQLFLNWDSGSRNSETPGTKFIVNITPNPLTRFDLSLKNDLNEEDSSSSLQVILTDIALN